jgi:hypothetical protein
LNKVGKDYIKANPHGVLDAFTLSITISGAIDYTVLQIVLKNVPKLKSIDNIKWIRFYKRLLRYRTMNRVIEAFNGLKISNSLYGVDLYTSKFLYDHVPPRYVHLGLALLFSNVEAEDLEAFLQRHKFSAVDHNRIVFMRKIMDTLAADIKKGVDMIVSADSMTKMCFRYFLKRTDKATFKVYRTKIRYESIKRRLRITEDDIKVAFMITDETRLKKILDIAIGCVMIDPTINKKHKLLSILYKEFI